MLGVKTSVPFFVAPAAMARLVHDEGEKGIARACAAKGVVECVSNFLSIFIFPMFCFSYERKNH